MFFFENNVYKSDTFAFFGVGHAFSTRLGGVSRAPHTRTMNLSFGLGDEDGEVLENMRLLCAAAGVSFDGLVGSPQRHTSLVRRVTCADRGEGVTRENTSPSDAFVTDCAGVSLIVRMADCVPLLFLGEKENGMPVVGAAHAGWKGTVGGISENTVAEMINVGADRDKIKVAIGQCIHECHFEVREDFAEKVRAARGADFAARHIKTSGKRMTADLVGMNKEILLSSGIDERNIDVSPYCTACDGETFHSHRASGGKRGTMGAVIGIV